METDKYKGLRRVLADYESDRASEPLFARMTGQILPSLLADYDAALATIGAQQKEIASLSSRCQIAIPPRWPNGTQTPPPGGAL